MSEIHLQDLGLELVKATEATALKVGRWLGLGNRPQAHKAASETMTTAINQIPMRGRIVIGEEGRLDEHTSLDSGSSVGLDYGPEVDVIVDPVDGTTSVVHGRPGAISVVAIAPRGSMWSPTPAVYMEKIIVDREAAGSLMPECMDAPVAWTLALIARSKNKPVGDLQVIVLDRPRHEDLIDEIRSAGARVLLKSDGDTSGALVAGTPNVGADILMGIGGVPEGVSAACAIKAMGGAMLGRLAPQSEAEMSAIKNAGLDLQKILTSDELVSSNKIFLAATGVTPGPLLNGVFYQGNEARTHSLLINGETGTRHTIKSEYLLTEEKLDE